MGPPRGDGQVCDDLPDHFVNRDSVHGASVFDAPDTLTTPSDFAVRYDFAGFNQNSASLKTLQDAGVRLVTHGMGSEWSLGQTVADPKLTASEKHDLLDATKSGMESSHQYTWPTSGTTYTHRYNATTGIYETERNRFINTAIFDETGEWVSYAFSSTLDVLGVNNDPDITSPNMQEGEDVFWIDRYEANAVAAGGVYDGSDLDNMTLFAGRAFWNYRAAHFAFADNPVCFHAISKDVCLYTGFTNFEYCKHVMTLEHAKGATVVAQGNTSSAQQNNAVYGPVCDQIGGETTFSSVRRRETARARRMLSGQKQANEIHTVAGAEAAMDDDILPVCMLYAMFPAINGVNYGPADFSSGDRTTCQAYSADLIIIDAAGYEYVPYVVPTDTDLIVERFGTFAGGDLHFSVYNTSVSEVTTDLTIDQTPLGVTTTDWDEIWPSTGSVATGATTTVSVTIPAGKTKTYAVTGT